MSISTQAETGYFNPQACQLDEFLQVIGRTTAPDDAPHAAQILQNVPIYDMDALRTALTDPGSRKTLMAEWAAVLLKGAGVLVMRKACTDIEAIDQATEIFQALIAEEKEAGGGADHFAAAGANDRLWNFLQKLCEKAPETFLRYHASTAVDAVCEAWLGPNYQMTAQVNLVYPGGAAQQPHRDYHLGFQTGDVAASYPAHVHDLSPVMTLQGGIAHCDMPLESGPTKLLPFSQTYRAGYVAWRRQDFKDAFEDRYVQLPLAKGDGIFFNPALFHAAGSNTTEHVHRMANLMQISSALGRSLEAVDRRGMCKALYPQALKAVENGSMEADALHASLACCAEGYPFPTNLDTDPPVGGLAPESQLAFFHRALQERLSPDAFNETLDAMAAKQRA